MLKLEGVHKNFGGIQATRDVSLEFPEGSISAIIGPNGAGKTTIFNLISAQLAPTSGAITLNGTSIVGLTRNQIVRSGVVRAFQVASLFPSLTVMETMVAAIESHRRNSFQLWRPFRNAEVRATGVRDPGAAGVAERGRHAGQRAEPRRSETAGHRVWR